MNSTNEGSDPRNLGARMYGEPSPETPRRLNAATVLQMLHEERMAQVTKPSRANVPAYSLKRSTASGSLGVVAIDVDVPVCDEFPTGAEAVAHLIETFDALAEHYPIVKPK